MAGWDRFAEWATTLIVASLTWVSGVVATQPATETSAAGESGAAVTLGWALDAANDLAVSLPEAQTDEETLDQGSRPAEDVPQTSDVQPVDAVPLDPTGQEDIELLDQGTPPAAQPVAVEPVPVAGEPVPAAVVAAPVAAPAASGPVLPPGFGSGRVQVAAGNQGFPEGLAACHVGAVTGRAYVGIGCDGEDSFVGHAPSFEDFPFVVEQPFPFNDNETQVTEPALAPVSEDDSGDIFVLNATGRADFMVEDPRAPNVETTGSSGSVISLGQQARHQPRERIEKQGSHRARTTRDGGGKSAQAQRTERAGVDVNAESSKKHKDSHKDKNRKSGDEKKSKNKNKNKHDNGKDKKNKHGEKDKHNNQESDTTS